MVLTWRFVLIVIAVVLFAVDLILVLVGSVEARIITAIFYGGLVSFAAGHLPNP